MYYHAYFTLFYCFFMNSTNTLPTPMLTPTVSANEVINQSINNMEMLMKAVYGQVKDACVPVDLLSTNNATVKVYYKEMYTYGASKVMAIK